MLFPALPLGTWPGRRQNRRSILGLLESDFLFEDQRPPIDQPEYPQTLLKDGIHPIAGFRPRPAAGVRTNEGTNLAQSPAPFPDRVPPQHSHKRSRAWFQKDPSSERGWRSGQ